MIREPGKTVNFVSYCRTSLDMKPWFDTAATSHWELPLRKAHSAMQRQRMRPDVAPASGEMNIQQFCVKQFQEGRLLKKSRPHWGVTHSVASSLWARFHLRCTLAERVCFFGFCFFSSSRNHTRHVSFPEVQTARKVSDGLSRFGSSSRCLCKQECEQTRAEWNKVKLWIRHDDPWWPTMTHDDSKQSEHVKPVKPHPNRNQTWPLGQRNLAKCQDGLSLNVSCA